MSRPGTFVSVVYYVVFCAIGLGIWAVADGRLAWWGTLIVAVAVLVSLRPVWNRFGIPWLTRRVLTRRAHS